MKRQTTYITLGEDELQRRLEQAARLGARYAVREHREYVRDLNRSLELARGLVTKDALARWLGRSKDTIDRWGIPHDCKRGRQVFYWIPDVIDYLRGQEGGEAKEMQEALDEALAPGR